jgi:hypothetical protein
VAVLGVSVVTGDQMALAKVVLVSKANKKWGVVFKVTVTAPGWLLEIAVKTGASGNGSVPPSPLKVQNT